MSRFKLSAVIIAHNEERHIAEAIRAVMKAASRASELLGSYEIVMVDDGSSDKTVEKASSFPITILQHEPQLGPAAARHTGYEYVALDVDYVLFVDGDAILQENWLTDAIKYLLGRPNVAGVSGKIVFIEKNETTKLSRMKNRKFLDKLVHEPGNESITNTWEGTPRRELHGGVALYKKKVLEQVGSFEPWVLGCEELELGFRIRQMNFELHLLNNTVAICYTKKGKDFMFHRVKFKQGIGQLLKVYRGTPLATEVLKSYYFHFFVFGWIVLCIPVALLSLLGLIHPLLWKVIAVISVSGYLAIAELRGGFSQAATILISNFFGFFGILVGLTKKRDNVAQPSARLVKKGVQISI